MIRSLFRTPEGELQTDLAAETFHLALKTPGGLLWVDFENNPPEVDEPILREIHGFHPLAIDDALQESHVPKIDDWGNYLYIVLHAVSFIDHEAEQVETHELDVFIGNGYLVTHHDKHIDALERVLALCQRDDRHLQRGADHLLYRLVDEVVASYMPVVEEMDEAIDHLEDEIFSNPRPEALERILRIKRAAIHLRRVIGPQREVLNKLARDDYTVIDHTAQVYFRDVYDHLVRLHEVTESLRDLISSVLDTYLSVINNRMNDIMKTLTVITTLFMPLSFISGFFGMNFFASQEPTPGWVSAPVLWFTLFIMSMVPVGMYLWMRRRGWM